MQVEYKLQNMPNIGIVLAEKLIEAGINTPSELDSVGSENAFIRLRIIDKSACLSKLYALEGAIQRIRWHNLDETKKLELKYFFKRVAKLGSNIQAN